MCCCVWSLSRFRFFVRHAVLPMSQVSRCPSIAELKEFLLGKDGVWDIETVELHLTTCSACQKRLQGIDADDDLVCALRGGDRPVVRETTDPGAVDERQPADPAAAAQSERMIENLLPRLKRIPESLDRTVIGISSDFAAPDEGTQSWGDTPATRGSTAKTEDSDISGHRLGRYELKSILGRGGMGTVYEAWDPLLERPVAIKVPRSELVVDQRVRERLIQEARAAAAIVDDHIVPIHAVEESAGTPWIVMPLLSGMTLKQYASERDQPLTVDEILRIGREAAAGLSAAHRRGLLHCDIKPGNLWLEAPSGRVKLLDFGLAVPFAAGGPEPTGGSGTPGYLAPEQVQGGRLDPRTDVFGLGCVLFQLATGRLPFIGPRSMSLFWTVMLQAPPAAKELRPDLSERLSDLIGRMIDRDPNQRPADGTAVLEELSAIEADRHARIAGRQRRRIRWGFAAAALLGGGGMGLWAAWFGPTGPDDVLMRLTVTDPSTGVVLVRDGVEHRVEPGKTTATALAPGLYEVRPEERRSHWSVYPGQLDVEANGVSRSATFELCGELLSRTLHTQSGTGVLFGSTGEAAAVFSVGQDRRLVRWSVGDGRNSLVDATDLPHAARCLALAADRKHVYTGGGNRQLPTALEIYRWEADGLVESGRLEGAERITQALDCSGNGRWVAAAGADGLRIWDSTQSTGHHLELGEGVPLYAVRWHGESDELAAVGESGQYAVWSLRGDQFEVMRQGTCGRGALRSVLWRGTELITAGDDGVLWRVGETDSDARSTVTGSSAIHALAMSSDGAWLLSGHQSGTVNVWSTADWRMHGTLAGHQGEVTALDIESGSRRAVSTGRDGTVRLWQLPAGEQPDISE